MEMGTTSPEGCKVGRERGRERQRKVLKKQQLTGISKDGKSQLGIELMNGGFSGWVALCIGSKPMTSAQSRRLCSMEGGGGALACLCTGDGCGSSWR